MDVDVTRLLDIGASLAIAVMAIIQMSRAHADCRRAQAELAARLLELLEALARELSRTRAVP